MVIFRESGFRPRSKPSSSLKAAEAYVVGQVGVARKEAAETKTARTDCWIGMLSIAAVAVLAAILPSAGSQ